ncbi:MAG: ribulose-phosphate 3-epimerase [Planctomycetaceae bacterium]|nr:ribulose-phosphate 3-epimerase [Planctomycetaceae bacterium]
MCDFGNLKREIRRLEETDVPTLHLDVMDGHFVPNLSYGLPVVETVRRLTKLPLEVHLMIDNPREYIRRYRQAGADLITIHREAVADPRQALEAIRDCGAIAGMALNPGTPIAALECCFDLCDLVLVMSVEPGFGGQKFERVALSKLRELRARLGSEVLLEVDGGVNDATIAECAAAGADLLVVGSAIFKHSDYLARVRELSRLAHGS